MLNRNRCANRIMAYVVFEREIAIAEIKNVFDLGIQTYIWQIKRFARQLGFDLFMVIAVQMRIAQGMNEFTDFQAANLGNHYGQQCINTFAKITTF